jgi:hypothetical protein
MESGCRASPPLSRGTGKNVCPRAARSECSARFPLRCLSCIAPDDVLDRKVCSAVLSYIYSPKLLTSTAAFVRDHERGSWHFSAVPRHQWISAAEGKRDLPSRCGSTRAQQFRQPISGPIQIKSKLERQNNHLATLSNTSSASLFCRKLSGKGDSGAHYRALWCANRGLFVVIRCVKLDLFKYYWGTAERTECDQPSSPAICWISLTMQRRTVGSLIRVNALMSASPSVVARKSLT